MTDVVVLARLDGKTGLKVLCGSIGNTCRGELARVAIVPKAVTWEGHVLLTGDRVLCMLDGWVLTQADQDVDGIPTLGVPLRPQSSGPASRQSAKTAIHRLNSLSGRALNSATLSVPSFSTTQAFAVLKLRQPVDTWTSIINRQATRRRRRSAGG